MNTLLEKLLPPFSEQLSVKAYRAEAHKNALKYGLPSLRDESWKYTSLKLLERRNYEAAFSLDADAALQAAQNIVGDLPSAGIVVFVGQQCLLSLLPDQVQSWVHNIASHWNAEGRDTELLNADALVTKQSADGFIWLNLTSAEAGLLIDVPADHQVEQPLHIVYLDEQTQHAWQLRHVWRLGNNAQLSVIEHLHYASAGMANIYRTIELNDDSQLQWLTLQQTGKDFAVLQHNHIFQQQSARCDQRHVDLGGRLARHETRVNLEQKAADYRYHGLLLGQQRQHHDHHLQVNHIATQCRSEQSYRTVLGGHARGVVHTAATVAAGADGSDVQQNTASMLLSHNAEMDTQPQLVIHADEVVASHGATIGQLDDDALFYLRSRGIPHDQAKQMLLAGFVQSVIEVIHPPAVFDYVNQQVQQQLEDML